ncbi:MAG: SEL1-like repeat protein [Pseudomonadales bacterium]|nr:SEL1-like repeat protein [Pseudomonadales bacterium]
MYKLISVIALLALFPGAASAGFDEAAEAYRNKNYPVAFTQFTELSNAGDARAQTVLALMYKYGEGTQQDLTASFRWYQAAAEQGYAPAQYNLGVMYADGLGTDQNRNEALRWLRQAAAAGFERANDKMAEMNESRVVSRQQVDPLTPWSRNWNFRLPNETRLPTVPDEPETWNYRVQLAALSDRQRAEAFWQGLKREHNDLFNNLSPYIEVSRFNGRELYRIQAGAFENFSAARDWCESLKQRKIRSGCLPLKTD